MQVWSGVHSTLCVLGKAETGSGAAAGACVAHRWGHTEQTRVCGTRTAEKQQLGAEGCSPGLALSPCTVCSCLAYKTLDQERGGRDKYGWRRGEERQRGLCFHLLPALPFRGSRAGLAVRKETAPAGSCGALSSSLLPTHSTGLGAADGKVAGEQSSSQS